MIPKELGRMIEDRKIDRESKDMFIYIILYSGLN